jgi:hypothetical protein
METLKGNFIASVSYLMLYKQQQKCNVRSDKDHYVSWTAKVQGTRSVTSSWYYTGILIARLTNTAHFWQTLWRHNRWHQDHELVSRLPHMPTMQHMVELHMMKSITQPVRRPILCLSNRSLIPRNSVTSTIHKDQRSCFDRMNRLP